MYTEMTKTFFFSVLFHSVLQILVFHLGVWVKHPASILKYLNLNYFQRNTGLFA